MVYTNKTYLKCKRALKKKRWKKGWWRESNDKTLKKRWGRNVVTSVQADTRLTWSVPGLSASGSDHSPAALENLLLLKRVIRIFFNCQRRLLLWGCVLVSRCQQIQIGTSSGRSRMSGHSYGCWVSAHLQMSIDSRLVARLSQFCVTVQWQLFLGEAR